jgi:hypothetical protein
MMAAIFQTESDDDLLEPPVQNEEYAWREVLTKLQKANRQPSWTDQVYVDGLVRVVTNTDVVIVKRNERRLWTASAARDDAEATMLIAMQGGDK